MLTKEKRNMWRNLNNPTYIKWLESHKKPRLYRKGKSANQIYKNPEIWKQNIKISMRGKHNSPRTEFIKGCISWMKGKQHTKESKEKLRLANLGKKYSEEQIKKCLRRRTPSNLEQKMINIIRKLNLPYKFVGNGEFFIERKNPDFINVNGEKIAIEVFYREHKNLFKGNLEQWKQERQEIFNKYGWRIEFFDEIQVNEEEIKRRLLL